MPENANRSRLQLVKRVALTRDDFHESQIQGMLFPTAKRGVVVFVNFPGVTEPEFRDLLENAKPALILELRSAPRFDIGKLTRQLAFQVFREQGSHYYDLTSPLMGRTDPDAALRSLQEFFRAKRPSFERPVVFLVNRTEADKRFIDRVLNAVSDFYPEAANVYEVPQFVTTER